LHDYRDTGAQLASASPAERSALAHRLRGVAANLGLLQLASLAASIEQGDAPDDAWQAQLAATLAQLQAALPAVAGASQPVLAAPPDRAALLPHLAALETACQHGTLADDSLAALAAALPPAQLAALQGALDEFDFDTALHALAQLRQQLAGPTEQTPP
jgi:HPt (histidine-containing phosphotransfer) domain-containing protein